MLRQGFEALLVLLVCRSQVRLLLEYSHQKPSQVLLGIEAQESRSVLRSLGGNSGDSPHQTPKLSLV